MTTGIQTPQRITSSGKRRLATQLAGRRATVMGLGHHGGGAAAARFLAQQGARVTVTDLAGPDALADSVSALSDIELAGLHLGGHVDEDFRTAELLIVNPAVRPDNRFVKLSRDAGAVITSEIELFLEHSPAPVIGVTGSNGKSTTAAMIGAILSAAGRRAWLGGNIERSLLPELVRIEPEDWVVLELSSFQLYWLSENAPLPKVGVITNCTPNHLDWHPDLAHYMASKARLMGGEGAIVLGDHLDQVVAGRLARQVVRPAAERVPRLRIPGDHNRRNAACAAAAALAVGCDVEAVREGLATFAGLPHRLQVVAEIAGRIFVNDTQATTPEATIAALRSLDRPCWLLCGGADKGLSFASLAAEIVDRASGAAFYGHVGDRILDEVRRRRPDFDCLRCERLPEGVAWCSRRSAPGHAILLSPACASTDQYRDYAHRAADFFKAIEKCDTPLVLHKPV